MPLIGTEQDAVRILVNRVQKDGGEGLQNFARRILGAHSEQARRLADLALKVVEGETSIDDIEFEQSETVQVQAQANGRDFEVTLKADRLPITSYEELVEFYDIDTRVWQPVEQSFSFWGNSDRPNFNVKARFQRDEYQAAKAEDRESFREWASQYAPDVELPEWVGTPNGKMLEVVISDLHVDRAGQRDTNLERMLAGVREVVGKARSLYGTVEEVNLVFLGDTFNSDNGRDTTTSGTPQESEHDWRETFRQTREAIVTAALTAAKVGSRVNIHILPGNHDYERAYYLTDTLWSFFHRTDHIKVVLDDGPRRYLRWGSSLIGLTHGDRVKPVDLAMSMFREQTTVGVRFFEWHLGHIHTRREDEIHGVTFQWFRTPSDPSEWEQKNLYGHNRKDITGIVWDRAEGPKDTFRHTLGSDQ